MAFQLSPLHFFIPIIVLVALKLLLKRRSTLPLPPGPPRFPFLGNAFDIPKHDAHETFCDMNAKYGASYSYLSTLKGAHDYLCV